MAGMISSRTVRAVVQRVAEASVRVEGETVGSIGPGLVVLLGVALVALCVIAYVLLAGTGRRRSRVMDEVRDGPAGGG